jgi:predicted porin
MKRTLLVAAVAALGSNATLAQSNATIYGRFNTSIERQDVGDTNQTTMVNNASRLGFKGVEDLGGGLKAGFQLEHGFDSDTGAVTRDRPFWARQSEVNLGSDRVGTLRLGRFTSEAYYATADYVSLHNHDTGTSSDAFYAYLGRDRDKVSYRTPEFAGLTAEAAYMLEESNFNDPNPAYDLAVNWASGPLALGLGYEKNGDAQQVAVRALYELGAFTFGGYVQHDKNAFGPGNRTTLRLSGMYKLGNGEFHLNWGRAGDYSSVPGDSSADQFTVAYNYNLSKLTKVYVFWTKVADSSAALYGGDFSSLAFGIRKNF